MTHLKPGSLTLYLGTLCALSPFSPLVSADESDQIIVSATRSAETVSSVPGAVQIIEGADIQEKIGSSGDLSRLLGKYVAGFSIDNETLSGGGETFRGRRAQILVNGAPRGIALRNNSRTLSLIDVASIARIEIIKGASSIHGDGGTGGIINIITKQAETEGLTGSIATKYSTSEQDIGSGSHVTSSADFAYKKGMVGAQLNGRFKHNGKLYDGDGTEMPADSLIGQGGGSDIDQYNLSGQITLEAEPADVKLYGSYVNMSQDIEYNSNYETDPISVDRTSPYTGAPTKEDSWNIGAKINIYDLPVGDASIDVYYNDQMKRAPFVPLSAANPYVYSDPGVAQSPMAQSVLFAKQAGVKSSIETDLSMIHQGLSLNWGFDYSYNDVTQTLMDGRHIIAPMKQHAYAFFAQAEMPIGSVLDLRAGLRHERFNLSISDFLRPALSGRHPTFGVLPIAAAQVTGADTSYRATTANVGAVAHLTDELDVFATYTQGYSVPDVGGFTRRAVDLTNLNRTEFDYSDIAPEAAKVKGGEIGTRFENDFLSLQASAFLSVSDKGTNFTSDTKELTQNKERIWGGELNVTAQLTSAWELGSVLAYTEGRWDQDGDGDIDDALPNNRIGAPFTATVFTSYKFDNGLTLSGDSQFSSGRDVDDGYSTSTSRQLGLSPTWRVNLAASYASEYGTFQAGIDNLFNRQQDNPTASSLRNLPVSSEGRRVFVGYKLDF